MSPLGLGDGETTGAGFELDEPRGLLPAPRARSESERLIPMINVVFLLLMFFLIAGTFRAAEAFRVHPPEIEAEGAIPKDALVLLVGPDGGLAIGKERFALEAAMARIGRWRAANPDAPLYLKADRAVVVGRLLPLLARLRAAGVASLRLVAMRRREPAP